VLMYDVLISANVVHLIMTTCQCDSVCVVSLGDRRHSKYSVNEGRVGVCSPSWIEAGPFLTAGWQTDVTINVKKPAINHSNKGRRTRGADAEYVEYDRKLHYYLWMLLSILHAGLDSIRPSQS
jgi:hypothetical protein